MGTANLNSFSLKISKGNLLNFYKVWSLQGCHKTLSNLDLDNLGKNLKSEKIFQSLKCIISLYVK